MKFIQFVKKNDPQLVKLFMKEAIGNNLNQIIKDYKLKTKFYFNEQINTYLIIIQGFNDHVLIKLAHKYNLPRGFPIIWKPDNYMKYFGFYPKFSNDDRQHNPNLNEFNNIVKLSFFKKWSGFLGQVLFFSVNGEKYWTVTTKNSADMDSQFIQDTFRLFKPFITPALGEFMINNNLHICAEMMSFNDQTHGAAVIKETPIITAIGKGCYFSLDNKNQNIIIDKFVEFYDHITLVNFCVKYKLPCDSAVVIDGEDECKNFMNFMNNERDFMDDTKLNIFLSQLNNKFCHQGTVSHQEILGDCLEGLVIKFINKDHTTNIIKYKFPNYIIRTMLFREEFSNFNFRAALKKNSKKFVNWWCVTEKGKQYWYHFALQCFMNYKEFKSPNPLIGDHIHIAEQNKKCIITTNIENNFNKEAEIMNNGTVIICVGPIGSGKTTLAQTLSKYNNKFVNIDGDILDLDDDIVLLLSTERSDYTRYMIIKTLMEGKIPVLSTGGGVLFSTQKNKHFMLNKIIYNSLKINVKIILFVPRLNNTINTNMIIKENLSLYDKNILEECYSNISLVKNAIIKRVNSGQWKINPKFIKPKLPYEKSLSNFSDFIASKSKANLQFAKLLIDNCDLLYSFPTISENNYGIQNNFNTNVINDEIIYPKNNINEASFDQIRVLTLVNNNTIGHITWIYKKENDILFSKDDFSNLFNKFKNINKADLIELQSVDNKHIISFVTNIDKENNFLHITINPGPHPAKEMKTATIDYNSKKNYTELDLLDGKKIRYSLNNCKVTSCNIKILSVFGI